MELSRGRRSLAHRFPHERMDISPHPLLNVARVPLYTEALLESLWRREDQMPVAPVGDE